ncbi:MAG: ATP-dependent RecD-like DNA helicase [Clostridia bacterium]|nr:ATP-dependent RecD-like DNA helicase [Clostridia bacterium]
MELRGQIEEIIYQNESNSYTIAVFSTEEEQEIVTVVGYLPFIAPGDSLKLQGKMVVHQEYGEQFKIDTFEKLMPQTAAALEKYLASGTIKGIGPATARKIIEKFGEETLTIFKFEPMRLAEIKGISKDKAYEIGEEFNEKWEVWQIVSFLEEFGIGANNSKKVYDALGVNAVEKIQENPYILVDIVYGVNFNNIDKIAMQIGIPMDSDYRIKSGIKYALLVASYNGHTCVLKQNLIDFVKNILEVDEDRIEDNLINLNVTSEIHITVENHNEYVFLEALYKAEKYIAERLLTLRDCDNVKYIKNFDNEIKKHEEKIDIELSEKQFDAVRQINENNVCIITGGPGTGKTTIIKCVLEIYKSHKKKVVLCAPTGRAAKRMSETTGEDAKTIHRLLEIGKFEEDKLGSIDTEVAPVDADVLVVDEMSMVDVFLMNYLVKALFLGTKVIFVGDPNQLPSVGPGSILKDLIDSGEFATVHLDKIFRQAAKSKIIVNAHNVNNGVNFIGKKDYGDDSENDFFYINESNQDKMLYQVLSLSKERLKNYGDYEFFKNIQVLTPTKKGKMGTKELNKSLQAELNPKVDEILEKTYGDIIFREGDRVMQIKNNYDIYWEKGSRNDLRTYESGTGVFNGEIGRIIKISNEERQIQVEFDDGKVTWYAFSELDQLEHAYAITIHKAQGSEFDVVILVVPQSSNMLLTRNLLYTGITRAKKLLIVIGNKNLIEFMVNNCDTKKRNTGLRIKFESID